MTGGVIIKELQINEQIRFKEVRLIGDDGEQLGLMSSRDALERAYEKDLDLVLLSPNANPPVCKMMDYSKYRYELIKKNKEAKKNQKTISISEVRLSPNIDKHDLETKAGQAERSIKKGNKVKVNIRFRGRELGRTEVGYAVMDSFMELVKDFASIEKKAKMEGRSMVMYIQPKSE